jgi:hypothetical protein
MTIATPNGCLAAAPDGVPCARGPVCLAGPHIHHFKKD